MDKGRFLQGFILFGFTALLLNLFWTGEIRRLVAPHMMVLLMVTAGVLIVMTLHVLMTARRTLGNCQHEHGDDCDCLHDHNHDRKPQKGSAVLIVCR